MSYATTLEEVLALRSENAKLKERLVSAEANLLHLNKCYAARTQEAADLLEQLVKRTEALKHIANADAMFPWAREMARAALTDEQGNSK